MIDLDTINIHDVPRYSELGLPDGEVEHIMSVINQEIVVANPIFFDYEGFKGVDFDCIVVDTEEKIKLRSFSRIILGKLKKLNKNKQLPIRLKIVERKSENQYLYYDFE